MITILKQQCVGENGGYKVNGAWQPLIGSNISDVG